MEKFTKGNWVVDDYSSIDGTVRVSVGNITIAILNDDAIAGANAHLIAAAPGMYMMLKGMADATDCNFKTAKHIYDLLAKARGEKNGE